MRSTSRSSGQVARFILPGHLLHRGLVISRIRLLRFERHDPAANPLLDEFRDGLRVVGPGQIHDQHVLPGARGQQGFAVPAGARA